METNLSKAQTVLTEKLKQGATLTHIKETWNEPSAFLTYKDGTCERVNLKVVRKLKEFNVISEVEQKHSLVIDYKLN